MSRSDTAALLPLAESIADGSHVDWDAVEARASRDEQTVIRQLRILSSLAVLHRTLPADTRDDRPSAVARRSAAAPAIGTWAHLSLIERLGGGTFGDVYRAWDGELEREVALKLLRSDEAIDDLRASRIATEGRLLARVHHPNVVTVHGVAAHERRVGLWMELVRGVTLEQQLTRHGTLSAREAALVGIDLCRALAAIHAAGLIHRDVKAQNVMREAGGRIVLMDLGTGREADVDGVRRAVPDFAGTPLYLAPEIFTGSPASERTDLYSLGVLLYHLVTGSFPVRATTIEELQAGHRQGGTRLRDARADLPTGFVKVVDRAISNDPSKRYESAGALEADLSEALDDTMPAGEAGAQAPVAPRRLSSRSAILAAVAAVLAIAVVAWPALRGRMTTSAPIVPGAIHSIAVLPLANLSGDPSQEYFADGLTDELIGMLGESGDINVISRTSAMQFKGSTKPLPEIARALHVDAVLEGSVRFLDGAASGTSAHRRVRVNARLIYAGTDTQLWNRVFESAASDPMALPDDLVRAIATGIDGRLVPSHSGGHAVTEQDAEVYDLYLKGRFAGNTRTRESLTRSVAYYKEALARDPRHAKAYAGLADAYRNLGTYGAMPYSEAIAHASQAAEQALAIDNTLGEAHAALGLVHDDRLEWSAADASFKHAIDLNPGYANARQWYATHLSKRGLLDEASVEIEKAAVLDPLSTGVQTEMAIIMFLSRRYEAAIAQAEKTLQLNQDLVRPRVLMAEALAQRGLFDRALEALDVAARLDPANSEMKIYRGCILALAGRRAEALQMATELGQRYLTQQEGHASDVAAIYSSLRDANRAFEWLERGHQARDPWLPYAAVDPWFDNIRHDPRFDPLLARLPPTQ